MKNSVVRLVALFAMIVGCLCIYNVLSVVISFPGTLSAASVMWSVLGWVALYGGYQTLALKPLGRRLLLVFFSCQIVFVLYIVFIVSLLLVVAAVQNQLSHLSLGWPAQIYLLVMGYAGLCVLCLYLLLRKDITGAFRPENEHRHIKILARTLALLAPGLGRALIANYWWGAILYLVCFGLVAGWNVIEVTDPVGPTGPLLALLTNLFIKLLIWLFFLGMDWIFVNDALKEQDVVSPPAEALLPEPGGE